MRSEQMRALLPDPRVAPLTQVLRDGTDEQILAASVELLGTADGRDLWDEAMRQAYPNVSQPKEN